MYLANLKQSVRSLLRNRMYTAINIAGLGVASAFVILVIVFASHAFNQDKYSAQTKNLYRIEMTDLWSASVNTEKKGALDKLLASSAQRFQVTMPVILAADLKEKFPDIEEVTRFSTAWNPVIRVHNQSFKEEGSKVAEVDENFFEVLGLAIAQGNAAKPFENLSSAVISERASKKYFGNSNPIGQTISLNDAGKRLFTVSAIAKDFPTESSLQFDVMTLVEGNPNYAKKVANGTNNMSHITLVKLAPNTNAVSFQQKLNSFGIPYFKSFVDEMKTFSEEAKALDFKLGIRPFSEGHFNASSPWPYYTDLKSLIQLILLAVIAVVIACVNYILLSLSRIAGRNQESGIRKTLGAGNWQIIKLFLTETQILVAASMAAGIILAVIALPYFSELANVRLLPQELLRPTVLMAILAISIILSFVSGIYPAIKMAGINPLSMMRSFSTYKLNPSLSRIFVTVQYTSCTVLIVLTIVIAQQMNFVYNKDLGFDKEQVLLVQNPFRFDEEKTMSLRTQLMQYANEQPAFTDATSAGFKFANGFDMNGHVIDGKREYISQMFVDFNYFDFNKIPIVQGHAFSADRPIDTTRQQFPQEALDSNSSRTMMNIVVNEKLYEMLGKPPLNEINRSMGSIIIGVCKNYDFMGAQQMIGPAYHVCSLKFPAYFWLKIGKQQNIAATIDKFKPVWNKMTNNEPFSFSFMDEDVKQLYESNARWMRIIQASAWIAIFIACLGLFGLSAITAISRTKEIGIRKIMGAGATHIYLALNTRTIALVAIAVVIAIPIARFLANEWLQDFAYRITIHWTVYAWAGIAALLCALVAVSFHSIKASKANPVNSLRTE